MIFKTVIYFHVIFSHISVITEGHSIDTTNLTMGKRILVEGGLTSLTIDEALESSKKTSVSFFKKYV